MKRLIIGLSGADGVSIGVRLLHILHGLPGVETHLVATPSAERNLLLEGCPPLAGLRELADFSYAADDMAAVIASGSFVTDGMIIAPCSMKTLAALASGYTENLLQRAADVCLKEGRKVVLLPREMPLGRIHLRNMLTASECGCTIIPPVLTFYNKPRSVMDHVDHILGKALLSLGIAMPSFRPWQGA
ncbi:MAG: UbiX family flavin prenyltransferase [Mailhella sp.]|nr:UbiX family flavin prenyltransferase [Mailhella sp.]